MTRNEETFSPVDADYYANSTNASAVALDGHAYAADCLLLGMATAEKQREKWMGTTVNFYRVTRNFRARASGWKDSFLSVGYNELAPVPGPSGTIIKQRVPIVDGAGIRASRPWPLDPQGKAIPDPSGTPANCEFRPYRSLSWSSLIGPSIGYAELGRVRLRRHRRHLVRRNGVSNGRHDRTAKHPEAAASHQRRRSISHGPWRRSSACWAERRHVLRDDHRREL